MSAGMKIGKYEVISDLGDGGMGTVKLAQAPSGRLVVLKQPHPHDPSLRELLIDEARVGLRLKHAHIVETVDFFEEGGVPTLVLAYVSGASLADLRNRGPLPMPVVCRIGRQIASALDAIHQATDASGNPLNVIHRDVTPANIMVGHDGNARLIDLGIAKSDDSLAPKTKTGYLRGTLRYLAPEIFENGCYSSASDIWSLGICLLDAALGRPALKGGEAAVVAKVLQGKVIDLQEGEQLDDGFQRAIRKLLDVNPEQRLSKAREAVAVFAWLEKEYGVTADNAAVLVRAVVGEYQPPAALNKDSTVELVTQASAIFAGGPDDAEDSKGAEATPEVPETSATVPSPARKREVTAKEVAAAEQLKSYAQELRRMETGSFERPRLEHAPDAIDASPFAPPRFPEPPNTKPTPSEPIDLVEPALRGKK